MVTAVVVLAAAAGAQESSGTSGDTMGKPRHTGPGYLTWIGFTRNDGGARVFVRLSSPPGASIGQARGSDGVVLTLPGYKLDTPNDGRALDTRYFGTDVAKVVAKPVKTGVEVHVAFKKGGSDAKLSTAQAPDGETLVYFDF